MKINNKCALVIYLQDLHIKEREKLLEKVHLFGTIEISKVPWKSLRQTRDM